MTRQPWVWLLARFAGGAARSQPWRALVQVAAIAAGVALGFAVNLINASALAEFSAAERSLSGAADVSVVGPPEGFEETWYQRIATDPDVAAAAPLLEVDATLDDAHAHTASGARGRNAMLHIIGIDALRSALIEPDLVGEPAGRSAALAQLLGDGLFVSPTALAQLGHVVGDTVTVVVGERRVRLHIVGRLPAVRDAVATMDLGFAQWRLDSVGHLSRIDVKFVPGADAAAVERAWHLPPLLRIQEAQTAVDRGEALSRAYRVNLDVLSMVALLTGAFLVFSLQSQAVVARRAQLALLRMLGATRSEIERMLIAEAAVFGAAGSALGLGLGTLLAEVLLRTRGADLGGGYFAGIRPEVTLEPRSAILFLALGVAAAISGAWLPAREAAAEAPAPALKAGVEPTPGSQRPRLWVAGAGYAAAALLAAAPPVRDIPLGAYGSIVAMLIATIALKPLIAPHVFAPLARRVSAHVRSAGGAAAWLAATRLARLPRFAAVGGAGILASFALMVAMATMVASFRNSFDGWLARMLPADLYARAAPAGSSARFSARDLERIRTDPAVARAQFSRSLRVVLDPSRAPVTLIARVVDHARPQTSLPLIGPTVSVAAPAIPVWVSEELADRFSARPGDVLRLPIGSAPVPVTIAGVWRDYAYARQAGSIVIDADDYERITEDASRTDAAIWMKPGESATRVAQQLMATLDAPAVQFSQPSEIRTLSLRLFDQTFSVTYVLELAAIAIGLAGLSATFSSQAIARTREFGMLRHLGVTRAQILLLLSAEAILVTLLAAALGLGAGLGIAWILVAIVNPQSFHWSMELCVPGGLLVLLTALLLATAAATSMLAGRRALSIDAVRAVKDDW